jgi:hypothetical protein
VIKKNPNNRVQFLAFNEKYIRQDSEDAAKEYYFSGYTTMCLNKTRKIIYIQVGYGKDVDDRLDDIIKKNL